ncbi:MAG: Hsp20/alpha crystallin family protein [Alphaproteobacteria bacterium]|nr:Hsp20/alpha crystallin family protein [Alphaproteobacteria bacterium]
MAIRDLINWDRPFGVPVRRSGDFLPSFSELQEDMNRLLGKFYRGSEVYLTNWDSITSAPAINIAEDENSFRIEAELPGLTPEAVDVSVTNGFLTIKGERKGEKEAKDLDYIRKEYTAAAFYRQIALPEAADPDRAEASFKNGILTVTLPKRAEAVQHPRKLQIKKAA